jgi:elongation factor P--(R)-beta-lysine ligase
MMDAITKVKRWADMVSNIRKYFDTQGFIEVSTPQLVEAGAFEACIDALKVSFQSGHAELNTSPEIEMKWVIAQTGLSVYQICKSYRDDPSTRIHFREFTMLEYYKVEADHHEVKNILKNLIRALAPNPVEFQEFTLREILINTTGIDLDAVSDESSLRKIILAKNTIQLSGDDTWDDMFLKLLIEKVEPALSFEHPTFLTDYPTSFAALASVDPVSNKARRFELYWRGIELANGCSELTDVEELKRRRNVESLARKRQGKAEHPYPTRLFEAVGNLPQCAGVAVGLDRLFMALNVIK